MRPPEAMAKGRKTSCFSPPASKFLLDLGALGSTTLYAIYLKRRPLISEKCVVSKRNPMLKTRENPLSLQL
jgi:hypothetical protein